MSAHRSPWERSLGGHTALPEHPVALRQRRLPGYIELRFAREEPLVGRSVWRGYFNDLGDRHSVCGPVYAEKFGSTQMRNLEGLVEDALSRQALSLIGKARAKVAAPTPL